MRSLRLLVESTVGTCVAIGLLAQPTIAASRPCSSGVPDAATIRRVDSLGWDLLRFNSAEADSRAFLLSPVGAWISYATLFSGNTSKNDEERNEYLALLGYTSSTTAERSIASDISAIRHDVGDDHVEIAQHLLIANPGLLTVPGSNPTFGSPCFETENEPIDAWSSARTHSLISSSIQYLAGGFLAAVGSQAMYLEGKPASENSTAQTLGSETLTTFDGGQDIGQPSAQYSHFSSSVGIQGVAEPIAGSAATMYLFTAPDRNGMFEFEAGLNPTTWPAVLAEFNPAQGAVAAPLDLRSMVYLSNFKITDRYLESLGGTVAYFAQEGRAIIDDTGVRFAVVSNFQINNPNCCADAGPTTLPTNPFFMNTVAPILIVVQDRSGLVLFAAGS